ncbi:MAG TPA: agmatine deiminase family protein, partial [Candidatus Tectomicrobia bacterium]
MPTNTPAALGYRMPAEWEPHAATWLAWPHNRDTWPEQLAQVQAIYVQLVAGLHSHETVNLLVPDTATAAQVRRLLTAQGLTEDDVVLHQCPTVDAWLRDSGPIFLTSTAGTAQPLALVDWGFNAWGGKYPEMLADNALPQQLADWLGLPRFQPGIVLEGGS